MSADLLLAGCAAYAPKIVVSKTGVHNADTTAPSTINVFNEHYRELYDKIFGTRVSVAAQRAGDARDFTAPAAVVITAEGANLSYQFCSSFFKIAGTEQQYLLFRVT